MHAETISAWGGKKLPFSSHQGASRTVPITSDCWDINVELIAPLRGKEGRVVLVCVCLFFFSSFFLACSINLSYSTVWSKTWAWHSPHQPAIHHADYFLKWWEQMHLTESDTNRIIQRQQHRRGKMEERTDKWRERARGWDGEIGWAWHVHSMFCERYRGQGHSRSWGGGVGVSFWSACVSCSFIFVQLSLTNYTSKCCVCVLMRVRPFAYVQC